MDLIGTQRTELHAFGYGNETRASSELIDFEYLEDDVPIINDTLSFSTTFPVRTSTTQFAPQAVVKKAVDSETVEE
jgi:hypothetical protein